MATQTSTQRQAAAQRGAAAGKGNTAKRSASATKASERRIDAVSTRLGAVGKQAQRAVLIQVGAAATVGDKVRETARTYTDVDRVTREFDRFERRGARAISRERHGLKRQVKNPV